MRWGQPDECWLVTCEECGDEYLPPLPPEPYGHGCRPVTTWWAEWDPASMKGGGGER